MVLDFYYKQSNRRHTHIHTSIEGRLGLGLQQGVEMFVSIHQLTGHVLLPFNEEENQCHSKQSEQFWVKLLG